MNPILIRRRRRPGDLPAAPGQSEAIARLARMRKAEASAAIFLWRILPLDGAAVVGPGGWSWRRRPNARPPRGRGVIPAW